MSEVPAAAPTPAPAGATYPGKTLGIVGLVLAIIANIIGLIISIVARSQSKKAGYKNTPATAGIIIGIITTLGAIILIIASVALASAGINALNEACEGQPTGTQVQTSDGVTTFTCP